MFQNNADPKLRYLRIFSQKLDFVGRDPDPGAKLRYLGKTRKEWELISAGIKAKKCESDPKNCLFIYELELVKLSQISVHTCLFQAVC